MKQTIQLRIGQSLAMTPQLQQSIRLLQLSSLDLQTEIQQALDSNPMLESEEDSADNLGAAQKNNEETNSAPKNETPSTGDASDAPQAAAEESSSELGSETQLADMPDELAVDSVWEDTYDSILPSGPASSAEPPGFENQSGPAENLHDHLLWQAQLTPFSELDMAVAVAIIDAVNEQGYLASSLDDIRAAVAVDFDDAEEELGDAEIETVLHRIHNFDPLGVGARDLRECLLVQLQHLPIETERLKQAVELIDEHFTLLANRDFAQLGRRMKLSQDDLAQVMVLVQSLNPRPGNQIASKPAEYIIPDVTVKKVKGAWRVELNSDVVQRVRVNNHYAGMVKRADNSSDNTYMKNQLQEARWFIKSLQSRNDTLLKVASTIVERQSDFLEYGDESMKALVLHDVAETVGMHESTVSRVTTRKYMHTPRGVFELKYFFSSHVATAAGGECSATAIRALIKKMIAEENPVKPLSDSKLADTLKEQGINVARRTIAKYRESIAIPSSSERKRLV